MLELLKTLNSFSPLGVIALLATIIYMLVNQKKAVSEVSDNHLSGLPEMAEDIRTLIVEVRKSNDLLQRINDRTIYISSRINGRSGGGST